MKKSQHMRMPFAVAAVIALFALFVVACTSPDPGPGDVPAPNPVDGAESSWRTVPLDDPPSESYALRLIQNSLARDLMGMWVQVSMPLWASGSAIDDGIPLGRGNWHCPFDAYSWERGGQYTRVFFGGVDDPLCMKIRFSEVRYTDDTDLEYSNPRTREGPRQSLPGSESDRRINNRNGLRTGEEMEISQSFEIEQSVESKSATEFALDMTQEATSKVTVGGEELGGSFEQELKVSFGEHFGSSEEQTKAESQTQTDEVKAVFRVEDGQDILAIFSNQPITTDVDYTVNGYYDMTIEVVINSIWNWNWNNTSRSNGGNQPDSFINSDNARHNYHNRCIATHDNPGWRNRDQHEPAGGGYPGDFARLKFDSLEDYFDFFRGEHADWPRLGDPDCSAERGLTDYYGMWPRLVYADGDNPSWIDLAGDKDRRRIELSGTQTRKSESAVTLTFYDMSGCSEEDADYAQDNSEDPDKTLEEVMVGVSGNSLLDCAKGLEHHEADRTANPSPTTTTTSTTTVAGGNGQ